MSWVNLITLYRIVMAPVLLVLVLFGESNIFKWLLALSFLTDAIDGIIARRVKAVSVWGARLDSIGDDMTFAVAVIGFALMRPEFFMEQWLIVAALILLFLVQLFMALYKYRRISSFHTYLAKAAAILQSLFLLSVFFFEDISYPLFYAAAVITALELIEEIVLVCILPNWEADVKGLLWIKYKATSTNKHFLGSH